MLDIKLLRSDPKKFEELVKRKSPELSLSPILALDERVRHLKTEAEELKSKRNALSKQIGEKKRVGEDTSSLFLEAAGLGDQVTTIDKEWKELEKQLEEKLSIFPNLPLEDIPISQSAKDNVCIKEFGEKREFSFSFKNHVELGELHQLFDFKRGSKVTGTGWVFYTGLGAQLEWALLNYMLDIHRENGFTQIIPPLLGKPDTLYGSAHLPKFADQLFQVKDEDYHLFLIPTAEAVLNGLHSGEILDDLPKKYVSYTPCFRREAGAAGTQERGLIRTHQFNKVELFGICSPEESPALFEKMLISAEKVVEGLDLHYKSMLLTTGDMSFASAKTVDIEVWIPGQDRYYEVSSVSNCTDFQARRSNIRFKQEGKPLFAHTLNGSGVATSRLMAAILENYQQEDGSIIIPEKLRPYLGRDKIS